MSGLPLAGGDLDDDGGVASYRVLLESDNQNWMTRPQLVYDIESWLGEPFGWDATALHGSNKAYAEWNYFGPDHRDPALRDALTIDWLKWCPLEGQTWMNPPYGYSVGKFIEKATDAAERGLRVTILIYDRTGTQWFRRMAEESRATRVIAFLPGREQFWDPATGAPRLDKHGKPQSATAASVVFHMGPGMRSAGQGIDVYWQSPWEGGKRLVLSEGERP